MGLPYRFGARWPVESHVRVPRRKVNGPSLKVWRAHECRTENHPLERPHLR